jgi:hypothetical protein
LINFIPAYYVRSRREATGGADLGEPKSAGQRTWVGPVLLRHPFFFYRRMDEIR